MADFEFAQRVLPARGAGAGSAYFIASMTYVGFTATE
jgi:hypothetical protein